MLRREGSPGSGKEKEEREEKEEEKGKGRERVGPASVKEFSYFFFWQLMSLLFNKDWLFSKFCFYHPLSPRRLK